LPRLLLCEFWKKRTKDRIFRAPQRFKNAIGLLLIASGIAGCLPNPAQPPIGAMEIPGSPTLTNVEILSPTSTPSPTEFQITPTKTPTEVAHRQVELVFGPDTITVPDSCKVIPEATPENTLTLNGQPLPDGTVIDTYQNITSITSGVYHQPTLLIAARAVAIETLDPVQSGGETSERYLLCYNVTLLSGDNTVIASVFSNYTDSGFKNTLLYTPANSDVSGLMLDQTVPNKTPIAVISNAEFIALFTSGTIIGQQVLLPFSYDYPSTDWAARENPTFLAIVTALKAGKLPLPVHFQPIYYNKIGATLVVPAGLVP
jgi:hypothetical protein